MVTLDGYTVRRISATGKAVGISKTDQPLAELTWLPVSACQDGNLLDIGNTDIAVRESLADEKGLDY